MKDIFVILHQADKFTVTLPASPTGGDVVGIKDYANTFDTNKCIPTPVGNKIPGSTTNFDITVEGSSIIIIAVDSTKGWVITDASKAADITEQALFITPAGGSETTGGDGKIHTWYRPRYLMCFKYRKSSRFNTSGLHGTNRWWWRVFCWWWWRCRMVIENHMQHAVSGCYTAGPLATGIGITVISIQVIQ